MSPRVVAAVIGVAFFLAGLLIMLLPLDTDAPSGFPVSCGNSVGMAYDEVAVEAEGAAFVEICSRLRVERLAWAAPVTVVGLLLVVGAAVVRRRRL
ncbi:PEP-CTERM sorting domain-containing protein [Saccharothrix sp. Mg75]|uniref:PEP-CTERM sorting domain-containing protein n=1 Tax=Saccharothrix sp. Mg75 TaxID=3445357 RepID=UPI003EEF8545